MTTAWTRNLRLSTTTLQTFARFLVVGGACTGLNLAFLWAATDRLHLHYLISTLLSFVLINAIGFLLNKYFTFGRWETAIWHELGRYYATMFGTALVNLLLMALLVDGLGVHYLQASVLVTAILMLINFLAHAHFTFKGHGPRV